MPELVVMAAGMGSRFGGLKQLAPMGPSGETVMDYSVFDAVRAGFDRVVFVIRKDFEADFIAQVGSRYTGWLDVAYAFQDLADLPGGRPLPEGRSKPWGTAQAVWAARDVVKEPFVAINADDFYGRSAFTTMADYLRDGASGQYALVGYRLANTLSEHGTVSRGVCAVDDDRHLTSVVEHAGLAREGDQVVDESGAVFTGNEPVSMNFWGLRPDLFGVIEDKFATFLDARGAEPKSELYLPSVIDEMIAEGTAIVDVLHSDDEWFGVTYADDTPIVQERLRALVAAGEYPVDLHAASAPDAADSVTWFAPGRIEVLGKHTDYAGGRSLLAAIDKGVTVRISGATSGVTATSTARKGESVDIVMGDLPDGHWGRYLRTVVQRLERNFGPLRGCTIEVDSTLPLASGMSSSSALIVATALGLARFNDFDQAEAWGQNLETPEDLATYLACIENGSTFRGLDGATGVGTFGGSEDHTAMVCGRDGFLARFRFGPAVAEDYIAFPEGLVFVACMSGVLAEKTGAARDLYNQASQRASDIVRLWNEQTGRQDPNLGQALASGHGAVDGIWQAIAGQPELGARFEQFLQESETFVPAAADALAAQDFVTFGQIALESHRTADALLANVVPETRDLAQRALQLGAYGASAFGAGFGGSVWALVDASQAPDFAQQWLDSYVTAFPDRREGASTIIVRPAGPTRQIG